MNTIKEFVTTIKRELLTQVLLDVQSLALPQEKAAGLAAEFIKAEPFASKEQVFEKLSELSRDYKEARIVFLKYAPQFYTEHDKCVLTNIRDSVEQGDMENAVWKAYWRCAS